MLICVDIGNTFTTYGTYEKGRFVRINSVSRIEIPYLVRELIRISSASPNNNIIISSVVPEITKKLMNLRRPGGEKVRPWIIGKNLRVRIRHNYRNINELGTDRLVNVYGGVKIYGAPLLIFDYGTALTCDFVSKKGVFLGGLIIPGPEISFNALSEQTALLPKIRFPKRFPSLLGNDPRGCMKAGILQSYGALTDGLVERFRRRFGNQFKVLATGGLAKTIAPYTSHLKIVDPLLTLRGLAAVYKDYVVQLPS